MIKSCKEFIKNNISIFCCPSCREDITFNEPDFICSACNNVYKQQDGIPSFLVHENTRNDVTQKIKDFYEETPFPDYDDCENLNSLIAKAKNSIFGELLNKQIPYGAKVLDCGCGTGQLTNFLAIAERTVIGTDISLNSLKLGHEFSIENDLKRAHFYQMNLFRSCFKTETFDIVISNGVLHHTKDPYKGFKALSELVKPGKYMMIGFYHKYGRLFTDLRRMIFSISGDRFRFLDPRIVNENLSKAQRNAWFLDQYKNPHESKHTISEVIKWGEKSDMTYINSIPKTKPLVQTGEAEKLFSEMEKGNSAEIFLSDLLMTFRGFKEGGFAIVILRKNNEKK